jgi:AmmeMemoRadiSam system protein B/AmmeMemoRadiSam system protein A
MPDIEAYETPLGVVQVDSATIRRLETESPFGRVPEEMLCDHSVEIQLPFIQNSAEHAEVVPLYVGALTHEERKRAAEVLRGLIDSQTILIASSDLTHYGEDFGYVPFALDEDTRAKLGELDERVIASCGSLDADLFDATIESTGTTVCGIAPIGLLLETLGGSRGDEIFQETLDYQTSGEITGDYELSVSYGALGYFPATSYCVNEEDGELLLASARKAVDQFCRTGDRPFPAFSGPLSLMQPARAFVSLSSEQTLRGCVGCFEIPGPLGVIVPQLAVAASSEDSRFAPVASDEPIDIEIHILTPKKRVSEAGRLAVGEHGAEIVCGECSGVLLASVATSYGLDRDGFLESLTEKAGLPPSSDLPDGAELYVFREQTVSERRPAALGAGAE